MTLIQRIKQDQLAARKAQDQAKSALLTTLLGEATMIGKNDGNRETADHEVVAVVKKFIKGVDENISIFSNRHDGDKINQFQNERAVLEAYLPQQMDASQLKRVLTQAGVQIQNKGDAMKFLKDKFAGQYDGKLASQIIDDFLKGE